MKMNRIALVVGTSEKCYSLVKQLAASWCGCVKQRDDCIVDLYVYICNYRIEDARLIKVMEDRSQSPRADWFGYYGDANNIPDVSRDLSFWPGRIFTLTATHQYFPHYYLPDIAIYHDFMSRISPGYAYVILAHDDVIFEHSGSFLEDMLKILNDETDYSIIAKPTINADKQVSFRFATYFYAINVDKFFEQRLNFISDHESLVDPKKYHVHGNGGSDLFTSFYCRKRSPEKKYKPHTKIPWVRHLVHTAFRFVLEDAANDLLCKKKYKDIIDQCNEDARHAYARLAQAEIYYEKYLERIHSCQPMTTNAPNVGMGRK